MLENYFKIAFRNLWKNNGFSFTNIFGLATGIGCSLLIFLFVKDELSYDNFHKGAGSVYRVAKDFINDDGTRILDASTPAPLAQPVGWYATNKWLQDFAYRINVQWWVFALAGGIAIAIAFITISIQTIKAALSNPITNLRTE